MQPDQTPSTAGIGDPTSSFEPHRRRLMGLAYRMLADRSEAEDVLQDAWLRWSQTDHQAVNNPEAFLVRVVTRLCLDRAKAARTQREVYVGPWLPEPVADAAAYSPETQAVLAEDLSFALLLVLDRLSPLERAAFLLHDVFDRPYSEVSRALERSEAACRQLASRARRAVRAEPTVREDPRSSEQHERLLSSFVAAVQDGKTAELESLLRKDVVLTSDGGGRVLAALNPIVGADRVSRFFFGILDKHRRAGSQLQTELATINGLPGLLLHLNGQLDQVVSISLDEQAQIAKIYLVRNPEKLIWIRRQASQTRLKRGKE